MIRGRGLAFKYMGMVINIKANGRKISSRAKELIHGQMEINTKDNGKMENKTVKVRKHGLMATLMKEYGFKVKEMGKASIRGGRAAFITARNMTGFSKMIKNMELVFFKT